MKIAMFTNTFRPQIGGVSTSVDTLASALTHAGHEVLVVAPHVAGAPAREDGVLRVPAVLSPFSGGFHIPFGFASPLSDLVPNFHPEIVHAHHPFLLGDTALRLAASLNVPTVFTYHTRYELYTHYVGADMTSIRRAVLTLSCGYCNLCNAVVAPSESLRKHLLKNGVTSPISVIPTGIDAVGFASGDGQKAREKLGIPAEAFVVGHVGRLASEKNLDYLANAIARFLEHNPEAQAIYGGSGSMEETVRHLFESRGLQKRVHLVGNLIGSDLADVYSALNVFAFSSQSETQGLVILEAMAAGVPVVALDAPGIREVVQDGLNGRLLPSSASEHEFASALETYREMANDLYSRQIEAARRTAGDNSVERYRDRILDLYNETIAGSRAKCDPGGPSPRGRFFRRELAILSNAAKAVATAFR